jgi:hypothetical protein
MGAKLASKRINAGDAIYNKEPKLVFAENFGYF